MSLQSSIPDPGGAIPASTGDSGQAGDSSNTGQGNDASAMIEKVMDALTLARKNNGLNDAMFASPKTPSAQPQQDADSDSEPDSDSDDTQSMAKGGVVKSFDDGGATDDDAAIPAPDP